MVMLLVTFGVNASMADPPDAMIELTGPGWRTLGESNFVRVNGDDQTLTWEGNVAHGSGTPIGVTRSKRSFENFELSIRWRHLQPGGNSGVFLWTPIDALTDLPPGKLPDGGIEIQMLDHDFTRQFRLRNPTRKSDWFTTDGDVFAVGRSTMRPFPPLSPNGSRSFPSARHSLSSPQWNHYYVRAVNGEVRLWVNGHEVSGGNQCQPAQGHLCLESEGAPIDFKDIRIRELP